MFCRENRQISAENKPILPGGGGIRPLLFFLHHPKTAQGIKLKFSDFKDTLLRHILQVKPVRYALRCCRAMATKLQEVPRRIWLHRKVKNQPFVEILS